MPTPGKRGPDRRGGSGSDMPPAPPPSSDMYGRTWTYSYRIRNGLLGAIVEQLVIDSDETRRWVRARWPIPLGENTPA